MLRWGQISAFVVLCAFVAVWLPRRWGLVSGSLLGVAVCFKVFPVLWLGSWLVRRQGLALGVLVGFVVLAGILWPAWALGWQESIDLARSIGRTAQGTADYAFDDLNSQSVRRVIRYWTDGARPTALGLPLAILACGATLTCWWRCRRTETSLGRLHGFVAGMLPLPFLVPTSWPHHFAWLPLTALVLALIALESTGRRGLRSLVLLLAVVAIGVSSEPMVVLAGGWEPYSAPGILLGAQSSRSWTSPSLRRWFASVGS